MGNLTSLLFEDDRISGAYTGRFCNGKRFGLPKFFKLLIL